MPQKKKSNKKPTRGLFQLLLGTSRVYIVEYVMLHVVMAGLVVAAINLFNYILKAPISETNALDPYALGAVAPFPIWEYQQTLMMAAVAIVLTPLFGLLYWRLRRSERSYPKLAINKKRRFVSYVFISLLTLAAIGYTIALAYSVGLYAVVANRPELTDFARDIGKILFAIGFIKLIMYLSYRLIRSTTKEVA